MRYLSSCFVKNCYLHVRLILIESYLYCVKFIVILQPILLPIIANFIQLYNFTTLHRKLAIYILRLEIC